MRPQGVSHLLVTSGDKLLGIVRLKDLLRFLDLRPKLEVGNGEVELAETVPDTHEPVVVYSTTNLSEAEVVKNALTAEGIRCGLDAENQGGFAGLFAVKVLVRAWDEERARQVIAQHTHHHAAAGL